MANKFDNENINTGKNDTGITSGSAHDIIERGKDTHHAQTTAPQEEQERRKKEFKTQGRKGCKAPRINVAFSSENYEYLRIISRVTGKTMTGYINKLLEQDREANADTYNQAKEFYATLTAEDEEN